MRLTGNTWFELRLTPTFDRRREIVLVAIGVSAIAGASVVSTLVDVATTKLLVPHVASLRGSNLSEGNGSNGSLVLRHKTIWRNSIGQVQPLPAQTIHTPPSAVAVAPPSPEGTPAESAQKSHIQSESETRKHTRLARRAHNANQHRFWQRAARMSLVSRGSISSER